MFKKDSQTSTSGAEKIKIATNRGTARKTARSPSAGGRSHPSIIAQDVRIEGNILSEGDIQVDGFIRGDIRASKTVIGRDGSVDGQLTARDVVIHGKLKGTIQAASLHLCAGSQVEGDIVQTSLTVDPEARFTGQIRRPDDKPHTSDSRAADAMVDDQRTKVKPHKTSVG